MRPTDYHQRSATAVAVALDDLNRALLAAHQAGLVVDLTTIGSANHPNIPKLTARVSLPLAVDTVED